MSFATFPSSTLTMILPDSLPLIFEPKTSHIPYLNLKTDSGNLNSKSYFSCPNRKPFLYTNLIQENRFSSYKALGATDPGSKEGDNRALETVLKLYTAIRNRNKSDLSDIIGEECRCVCNFIAAYQPFYGKKQVLDFFSILMKNLGRNIQFVVQPTLHDGMNVGISWKLEWRKTGVPLGKGFSFYMCHIYQGKVMIRNVEMFMEPLFHIEPLRLKIMGFMMNVIDKIGSNGISKIEVKRTICLFLALFLLVALLRSRIKI